MDSTGLLITILLGGIVSLLAGVACWVIDRKAKQAQADWDAEGHARGIR